MSELLQRVLPDWLAAPAQHRELYAQALCVIVLAPLAGFLVNAVAWRSISRRASGFVACLAAGFSLLWSLLSYLALTGAGGASPTPLHPVYADWINVGGFSSAFGLYLDPLSATMVLFVTGIGTLIHIYSIGYMERDAGYARYFAYLNLFLSAMLVLVLADNLVLMFVGWEGVGLCSYLLIGFWYEDAAKAAAGMKAFVFNRIGDLGFLIGIFVLFAAFGTVSFVGYTPKNVGQLSPAELKAHHAVFAPGQGGNKLWTQRVLDPGLLELPLVLDAQSRMFDKARRLGVVPLGTSPGDLDMSHTAGARIFPGWTYSAAITLACILLFVGACGKSAQLPLYAWLPDAMAGPTPVSALIHAATMVTAGVYMVARLNPLFSLSPTAMMVVSIVGAATALFAALIGLTQTDIKKVLAYSTISQLGYMFLAAGVGAYSLAIFHVVTHAFFKALLFLGAGCVIHALAGEQEMAKMGGLRKKMPVTFWTMLIGALALSGIPFTSGWYSKDAILAAVLNEGREGHAAMGYTLYGLGVAAAFCTAFYTFRLISLTFFGKPRATEEVQAHIHEAPRVMTIPLAILAAGALLAGALWQGPLPTFLGQEGIERRFEHVHWLNLACTTVAALAGVGLALVLYVRQARVPHPETSRRFLVKLSWNKFYIDDFYTKVVGYLFALGADVLHLVVDILLIDTLLVRGTAWTAEIGGRALRLLHTGFVNGYALGILGGAVVLLYWLLR